MVYLTDLEAFMQQEQEQEREHKRDMSSDCASKVTAERQAFSVRPEGSRERWTAGRAREGGGDGEGRARRSRIGEDLGELHFEARR